MCASLYALCLCVTVFVSMCVYIHIDVMLFLMVHVQRFNENLHVGKVRHVVCCHY